MNKFKLTKHMDLIQIYKDGQFNEFKKAYSEHLNNVMKYLNDVEEIREKYFPELIFRGIDFNGMTDEEVAEYSLLEYARELDHIDKRVIPFRKDAFLNSEEVKDAINTADKCCEDPDDDMYFQTFDAIRYDDANVRKLIRQLFFRKPIFYDYLTIADDAKEFGVKEIFDFICENPMDPEARVQIEEELNRNKLIKIREDSKLDYMTFSKKIGIDDRLLSQLEEGKLPIRHGDVAKYAAYLGCDPKDVIDLDRVNKLWSRRNRNVWSD